MRQIESVCGRDVDICIDGKKLLWAEKAELRKTSVLHGVRACFCSDDQIIVRGRTKYKLDLSGLRFRKPFEQMNLYDLDSFTVRVTIDGTVYEMSGCMWDDYAFVADKEKFREHISITALRVVCSGEECITE